MRTISRATLALTAALVGCAVGAVGDAPDAGPPPTSPAALASTQIFGMYYATLQCGASPYLGATVFDITRILAREAAWGPLYKAHWWGRPDAGYYCASDATGAATLRRHAELLRDAGIAYVYLDVTNHPDLHGDKFNGDHCRSDRPETTIQAPFERMLAVWHTVDRAPKIVPWVRVVADNTLCNPDDPARSLRVPRGDMIDYFQRALQTDRAVYGARTLAYLYNDKPVVFVAPLNGVYATTRMATYASTLTMVKMWSDVNGEPSTEWSFMSRCRDASGWDTTFRDRGGNVKCNQRPTADGLQIAVSPGYHHDHMSNFATAMPKFHGYTLMRQLETAWESNAPFVTISGWNEWIALRQPAGFVDHYNKEFNRDLEPGGDMGDFYYQLLKRGIAAMRAGQNPMTVLGTPQRIRGWIDAVTNKVIYGWACAHGAPSPIDVHVYVGGPAGVGRFVSSSGADFVSEPGVATACGSWGNAYRFRVKLPPAVLQVHQGKAIHVHGIHPTGAYGNELIGNSGVLAVPRP